MFDYEKHERILFLGEGNFSFSSSFLKTFLDSSYDSLLDIQKNVYCTCYQSRDQDDTCQRAVNLATLKEFGANVLFEVDATKLHKHEVLKDKKFDKIIFMYPHVGGKMKIHLNRELLRGIFESSKHVLDHRGKLYITLCAGQGGTPFETKQRRKDDTWKILDIGLDQGFLLTDVFNLPADLFPEYCQVGYRSLQKGFNIEDSVVHVFQVGPELPFKPISTGDLDQSDEETNKETNGEDEKEMVQLYPLRHVHHLSFWCNNQGPLSSQQLMKVARLCLGDVVQRLDPLETYTSPEGRTSQTVEIEYLSRGVHAVGPRASMHLHYRVLGQSLVNAHGVVLR